ncbi:uncharacterized protein LOC101455129 [Ceratitis capitata]|uniref:(Mediterranean fruit fly) hypothetical protein n=1 Tax=Ceratitis capitata TaxID=7213 RepID=W8BZG0_CERCA|nr:uncharacterized protein LOC101455129 [Ceratitis capitata]CAD7003731.1 unnamed protein product [Ceratitis capitata]
MNSKLIIMCICVCLSTLVNARPQNWQSPIFSNPFLPERPVTRPTTPAPPASSTTVPSPQYLACLAACPSTMEYNPVCGSDNQNYHNHARLDCATRCGQVVSYVRMGTCNAL